MKKYFFFIVTILLTFVISTKKIESKNSKTIALSSEEQNSYIYFDKIFNSLEKNKIKEVNVPKIYRNGILFTFLGDKSTKKVFVAGEFSSWKKHYPLIKTDFNLFYNFIPLKINKGHYKYKFIVNNIWINDPLQPYTKDDHYGQKISSLYIPIDLNIYSTSPQYLGDNTYLFFLKDEGYQKVNWIGSDNKWDKKIDPLVLKNGYWSIQKKINPKKIFYKFKVDNKEILDPNNPNQSFWKSRYRVNVIPINKEIDKK